MADPSCGASVQACALRIATLEQDGVPIPGAAMAYVTDEFTKLTATPNLVKGADLEMINACGVLNNAYKQRDMLKRYDLALDMIFLSADFEGLLVGNEVFTLAGSSVGGAVPPFGSYGAPYGTSLELWSKHIVNGDFDPVWPYIQWIFPRTYWSVAPETYDNNPMARSFMGYTSQNPNYFNGPFNDWNWDSSRMHAWQYTKTLPNPVCGSIAVPVT